MNKLQYNVKSYNGFFAMFSVVAVYPIAFITLFAIFKWIYMPSEAIGILLTCLIFALPLIFLKKIKAVFTSKVLLEMDRDSFSVSYLDSDGESVKKQRIYKWESIESYNFYFGQSSPTITALTIHFKKGFPKSFNFFDKEFKDTKSFNEMFNCKCLLTLFYDQVKQYNSDKAEENQIQLLAGFFASKTGNIIIYLLAALIVATIILHLIIAPKSSFATLLISIGLVAGFFSKRKSSLELYKKIKELDNK